MDVLKSCYDPEIPINIVDLGLIYNAGIKGKTVNIEMTLTSFGCPVGPFIASLVEEKVKSLKEVERVNVNIVWKPPWNRNMMSKAAKEQLKAGLY